MKLRAASLMVATAAWLFAACGSGTEGPHNADGGDGGSGGTEETGGSGGGGGSGGEGGSGGDGGSGGEGGSGGSADLPAILALQPDHGIPGTSVTIVGRNFGAAPADNQIFFNEASSATMAVNEERTELTTAVPAGATTGPVRIIVDDITVLGPVFTVDEGYPAPVITSVTPNRIEAGSGATTVTLTGTGFVQESVLSVNDVEHPIDWRTPTSIRFRLEEETTSRSQHLVVRVRNPEPGGGASEPFDLFVYKDFYLDRAVAIGPETIRLVFTEPLDPEYATTKTNYTIEPFVPIVSAARSDENPLWLELRTQPHAPNTTYTITLRPATSEFGGTLLLDRVVRARSFNSEPEDLGRFQQSGCGGEEFSKPSGLTSFWTRNHQFLYLMIVETYGHQLQYASGTDELLMSSFLGYDGEVSGQHGRDSVAAGCPGGEGSDAPGAFRLPRGTVVFDQRNGILWAADTGNGRLHRYEADASYSAYGWDYLDSIGGWTSPIVLGSRGEIVYVADVDDSIHLVRPDGSPAGTIGTGSGEALGQFSFAIPGGGTPSLAMALTGDLLLVAEPGNHRIQRFVDGAPRDWLGGGIPGFHVEETCCSPGEDDYSFSSPRGVAIDDGGFIYVADEGHGGRVLRYDSEGTLLRSFELGFVPGGLMYDPKGTVWITDEEHDGVAHFRF